MLSTFHFLAHSVMRVENDSVAQGHDVSGDVLELLFDQRHQLIENSDSASEAYTMMLESLSTLIPCDWCSIVVLALGRRFIEAVTYSAGDSNFREVVPALHTTIHEDRFVEEFFLQASGHSQTAKQGGLSRWAQSELLVRHDTNRSNIQRYGQSERGVTLSGGESRLVRMYQRMEAHGITRRYTMSELNQGDPVMLKISKRQKQVIAGLTLGYNTEAIARKRDISRRTVESHIYAVQVHLGIPDGEFDKRILIALRFKDHKAIQAQPCDCESNRVHAVKSLRLKKI